MRNLANLLVAAFLVLVVLSGSGFAASHPPTQGSEITAYMPVMGGNKIADHARVFRLLPGYFVECNQEVHSFDVQVRAQVAQWARVDIDFTGWSWYVRKPGTYFADSITAKLASNGPLTIVMDGFGNLQNDDSALADSNTINTWFAYTVFDGCAIPWPGADAWVAGDALDGSVNVPDSAALHKGLCWKLWNKIEVVECNSAGLYQMGPATISITLDNFSDWAQEGVFDGDDYWETRYVHDAPAAS